ncbi:hemolysin family protein [Arthrobacter castelli]|uniref:hemolysin family protein n=1 Tax=Arthrobacter castelli TaxID=271431 RepID=UPI0004212150|nr:hemolysin family protein [Arthrobacter castelli]
MDTGTLLNFLLVLLFVLIGGVFAGTEMALVSLRQSQIREIESSGRGGAKIAALARNPNRFLSAVQIGVTVSGFFSAAFGASAIAPDVAPILESLGIAAGTASTVAFIGTTVLVAYLSLVLGELVPKRLAMQSAVGFTKVLAPPLNVFSQLMRPVIWLLSASTNGVVRILGGDPHAHNETVTADELRYMVADNESLSETSRGILTDVFGASDRLLQEVMRPRTDVTFIDSTMTLSEARDFTRGHPYSRYPVVRDSPDDVVGFIHMRDLMPTRDGNDGGATVADIGRDIIALPGTSQVLPAFSRMRAEGQHIVLVVDEYGGTDGIVTMEDLVEELVGEIYDEYDTGREPEDRVRRTGDAVEIDGGLILQEVDSLVGITLPEGPYETVGGFITERLGRLPKVGDVVEAEGNTLTVLTIARRRIGRIRVRTLEPEVPNDGGDGTGHHDH